MDIFHSDSQSINILLDIVHPEVGGVSIVHLLNDIKCINKYWNSGSLLKEKNLQEKHGDYLVIKTMR